MDFGKKYQLRCALRHDDDEVCGIAICGNTGKIVTSSDRMIRLWTVHGEDLSKTSFDTPASTVRCISWIPPNPTLKSGGVSGCVNNAVVVWDVDSGKIVKTLDHESEVTGIVVDGDDLVSSSIDGNLKRWSNWNCSNCTETWAAHEGPIQAVIKLPTGELVTGSSPILGSRDSSLKIWKGKVCLHTFHGHADTVCGLAAMSDFGILSASHDGSLRLWAFNGHEIMNMSGHTATVCSVDSHASGLIVSGSEDRLAKIWKESVCVQSIEHPGFVWDTKFMENGDIVTACSDGVVRIWTVNQNHFAGQRELDLYTSQLSINKSMHKKRKLDNINKVAVGSEESNRPSFDGVQHDYVIDTSGFGRQYGKLPFNKSEVAEKPKVECVVNTDPMRFRPSRNMGDMTDLWVQRFNAMIKEKEKVAAERNIVSVLSPNPFSTGNMDVFSDRIVYPSGSTSLFGVAKKKKVESKPCVFTDAFIAEKPDMENVTEEQV